MKPMDQENEWRGRVQGGCEKAATDGQNMSALARECGFTPSGLGNFRRNGTGSVWKVQKLEEELQRRGYLPLRIETRPNIHGQKQNQPALAPDTAALWQTLATHVDMLEAQCRALALYLRAPGGRDEDKARRLRTELEFLRHQADQLLRQQNADSDDMKL